MFSIFWLAFLFSEFQARPAPALGLIQGTVVRPQASAVGLPSGLAGTRVVLKPGNLSTITGSGGAFIFRSLAPGRYTISVMRDGFIPLEDRQHGFTASGLTVNLSDGQTLKDIVLPMTPAPAISGKVFDPQGQPLAAALVRAYRRQYTPEGTKLRVVRTGMTNDMGEFRLFGLNFGAYFVSAGYGDRDRAAAIGRVMLSANVSRADDGYATVFYDRDEDLSHAKATRLAPGIDPTPVNIYLIDSARYRIRGQVLPSVEGTRIVLAAKGSDVSQADYFTQPDSTGGFEIRGVSPGAYVLLATAGDEAFSSDVIAVNVTSNHIDGLRLALEAAVPISGSVSVDDNLRANLGGLRVKLERSSIEFEQRIETRTRPDGSFILPHVSPRAEYDIGIDPLPSGAYIKTIASGGLDVLKGKSRLFPGQALRIVLGIATGSLEVHVMKGADPTPGAQVVLVPDVSMRRRTDRYIAGFTGQDGIVVFSGIPPGGYTAYAFEEIEPGAYYALANNPAAESRFKDHSVSVTIGENRAKSIQLSAIGAADTMGAFQ